MAGRWEESLGTLGGSCGIRWPGQGGAGWRYGRVDFVNSFGVASNVVTIKEGILVWIYGDR